MEMVCFISLTSCVITIPTLCTWFLGFDIPISFIYSLNVFLFIILVMFAATNQKKERRKREGGTRD